MFYPTKNDDIKNISNNTEKFSKLITEIERFIEIKKKKPTSFEGIVEKIDLSNNTLTIKLSRPQLSNFSKDSLVLIKDSLSSNMEIRATVKKYYNSTLKLEMKHDPSIFENRKVWIDTEKTNVILERLNKVIKTIKNGEINQENIRILDILINNVTPKYNKKIISQISKKLNENQKEGVINSIKAEDFHLIIGPPGTGKTFVIEELIKQFKKKKKKTLITAWSNLAVDNIIKRLPNKETKNCVRIGPINKVDPKIKHLSIFEKMTKHEDWKDVEKQRKLIDELIKSIPKIKKEIDSAQDMIDQRRNMKKEFNMELNTLMLEKQKYEKLISNLVNKIYKTNINRLNEEISIISNKSEICSKLSKNILNENKLKFKIPKIDYIKKLKKDTRNSKLDILSKKIYSLFSNHNNVKLESLEKDYKKNKKHLSEINNLQKIYNNLKKENKNKLNKLYLKQTGHPDEDTLNYEFRAYNKLKEEYLSSFEDQEYFNTKNIISKINYEVYTTYLTSLIKKIELIEIKINGINTEMYVQINQKKDLNKKYINIVSSLNFYKKNLDRLKKSIISDILENADIIASTAVSSCHPFLDNIDFDVMIMDESTQVASFMSLLPLLKCKKFVLVGDNKQLQPIEEEDISPEMNLSIFNRLFKMYPKSTTFLSTQYRMHKTIAQIANEIFYEGKLRTSKQAESRILNLKMGKHLFLNPKIPVAFLDTSKVNYFEDGTGYGCSNTQEAKYIAYIVSLFIKKGIKMKDIAVITPYVKQKLLIKEFLNDIKIKDVEVNTIHKFQGREKDIIIMSFAKSKKYSFNKHNLRFIENGTLVNVAITRARKKLILVGNTETLNQSKLLNKLIDKIGKENSIVL
jgi:superfamily I DNA and/or RNA helicase